MFIVVLYFVATLAEACSFDEVNFDSKFSGGRLSRCQQLTSLHYSLHIVPENEPVNPSPWYNFKVSSKKNQKLTIELNFNDNYPRYLPKISVDGEHWQNIAFTTQGKTMVIQLDVSEQSLWVAAQEPIDNPFYDKWLAKLHAQDNEALVQRLGLSTEKRPIDALVRKNPLSKEWLVVIGRQHPPEVTGAMALFSFVESLLADSDVAKQFRQRFNLIIIPNLNPDGVAAGNWRHNAKGVDLNRDWKTFEQVESKLVRDKLATIVEAGDKIVFALDFHSTYHDVFYTMPKDYTVAPALLVTDWIAGIKNRTKWVFNPLVKAGTNPEAGVFKQFIADTYQVHAVTYEVGDNTNREEISYVAKQAAQELMLQLSNTTAAAFAVPLH
ncbi:M14-type cytosolic carboxypeptidase [Paraglaciecola sp.]|uniref:M14 family metallopeptidase n=1 Tax=Paraglaciecola sp. TaxID=1920173 RepID=UPI0030F459A7